MITQENSDSPRRGGTAAHGAVMVKIRPSTQYHDSRCHPASFVTRQEFESVMISMYEVIRDQNLTIALLNDRVQSLEAGAWSRT